MGSAQRRQLTDEQARAVTTRAVSVSLSAGAGCGKTFVLTERFLAALVSGDGGRPDPNVLSRLVAITFTERAVREMRNRVRETCRQRLLDAPSEEAADWLKLVRQLDTARISTIHSFCGSLLRSHAVEAGLDPHFRVLQAAQSNTLLVELVRDELQQRLAAGDEPTLALAVDFGLQRLPEMVTDLLGHRAELDWPRWTRATADDLLACWQQGWREEVLPRVLGRIVRSEAAGRLLDLVGRHAPSHAAMQERCRVLAELLPRLASSVDPAADLAAILENAKVQGGGGAKAWPSVEAYEAFRDAASALREAIKKCQGLVQFSPDEARPAAQAALDLLAVTAAVDRRYQTEKDALAVLDFDDLLIRARALLMGAEGPCICHALGAQIQLLLVDEFQDTDPVQVEIVEALCGSELARGKLFFVGDAKQSIYRFRGADPHVFRRLREALPDQGRLPLTENFRSQPAILEFVNALCCEALGPEYEPLRPNRGQASPRPAVEFLWASPQEDEEAPDRGVQSLRRREARWIARRIRNLLDTAQPLVWDAAAAQAGQPAARPVRQGDVAILFRALSDVAAYEEALREYGIDYYLVGGHAFYAQQEIFDLVNLLRAVEHPHDEVALAGALRSGFFNLEDESLFWLAQHHDGLSAGLFADPITPRLSRDQRPRAEFAAATLRALRELKDRLPIALLIQEALTRTGYDALLVAEFLGERKLANLQKLVEQARQFDAAGIFTLADFITQLSEFVARQPDEPLAATSSETADVVRLMSIHQSKGLEFPVVVLPDLDRSSRGPGHAAAGSRRWGPVVRTDQTGGFQFHQMIEAEEDQAELVRLLYVATTRAADYLILSSGVTAPGAGKSPWMDLLRRRFDLVTGRLQVELPAGYAVPEIRVTTTEPEAEKPRHVRVHRNLAQAADMARDMADKGSGHVPPYLEPVPADPHARRQYSFSRLSGRLQKRAEAMPADQDDSDTPLPATIDPPGLGTLVHAVLADADFTADCDVEDMVRRHALRHLPEADDLPEAASMLRGFLASPRAAAMRSAAESYREVEFLLAWPPEESDPSPVFLQGFIDNLYHDSSGGWHLVDYKTNRVTPRTLGKIAADYEMQMLLYALAAETTLGVAPVELVLHFLRGGLERSFAWNAAAKTRLRALIDAVM